MASFGDYLNKYGVRWIEKPLSYKKEVLPNRAVGTGKPQKLTGIVAHTEGVPTPIAGNADRDVFSYFNNKANGANAHAFVMFSGTVVLYLDIEQGSWGAGNNTDNVQTYQMETQDNGRYRDGNTYTYEQYRAWAGVYCAVKDWAKEHHNIDIPFKNGANGIRRHNQISTGRECPGALNTDRIMNEAAALFEQVNNPAPIPNPEPVPDPKDAIIADFKVQVEAWKQVASVNATKVDELGIKLAETTKGLESANKTNIELGKVNTALKTEIDGYRDFKTSFWYSLYILFKRK